MLFQQIEKTAKQKYTHYISILDELKNEGQNNSSHFLDNFLNVVQLLFPTALRISLSNAGL